ncbi:MAG: type IX secretion system membrane protein PorP/SprF [Bacteroidota bacterium]
MKNTLIALLILLITGTGFAQQDNQYTQFMYNKLALNPAYAGTRGMGSFLALFRQQWVGFKGAPQSKLLSFDSPIFGDRVGFGLTVSNNTVGIENKWNASMAYSYHIKISKEASFRFGLQGSVQYLGLDFSDPSVVIREEGDNSIVENDSKNQYLGNFGVGIYFTYQNLYFGASVPNIYPSEVGINTDQSILETAKTVAHYYLMAGTMVPLTEKIHLKPAFLFKYVNNAPYDLDFNLSFVYDKKVTAGLSYRLGGDGSGESIDLLVLYQYKNIGIGVAYDLGLTELNDQNSGSVEALLRYDFLKEREDIANPRFFF